MRIDGVGAVVLRPTVDAYRWKHGQEARHITMTILSVHCGTLQGNCMAWLVEPDDLVVDLPVVEAVLTGRWPHEVEAIGSALVGAGVTPSVASTVDIALWDLLGRQLERPVHQLLGGSDERVRAYASTITYDDPDQYVQVAQQCRQQGFTALKLHLYGDQARDIEVCRAVRDAVGESMDLMLDSVNAYNVEAAVVVGRAIQELGFTCFEAPIADDDTHGLRQLKAEVEISLAAGETVTRLGDLARLASSGGVDTVRSLGDWIGGITALRKVAALCEALGVRFDPHSYGSTSIQAAHLAVVLSSPQCDAVELPIPLGMFDAGMQHTLTIGADGRVEAPTRPGLGYDVDWNAVDSLIDRSL